jgi:nicotinate-nucleotide adenylyltransferase
MIGVFGGTFDPVHFGHLRAALEVKESLALTQVLLIPSAQPPHRDQPGVSAESRLQMLELAVAGQPDFTIDNRELLRAGRSYMVDTLQSLRLDFPEQSLLLIIGMDAFAKLESWYHWQQLFDFAHVIVMTRPNYQLPSLTAFLAARHNQQTAALQIKKSGNLHFLPVTALDISATAIRSIFAQQRNPKYLLPDAVIDYINQHNLYR